MHMIQHKVLLFECAFACDTALHQQVLQLQSLRRVAKGMNQWKRVFSLVKILAKALLCCVLLVVSSWHVI